MEQVANFLRFIRFSHTVFALPFALASLFVAADGWPGLRVFGGVIAAMVFARTAAMTFNRVADWEIDQRNPRTESRHRLTTRKSAVAACVASSLGFVASAWWLNDLCFLLSPVALGIVFFYSLTKRLTHFAQFFLGFALSVAPVGAWIAVTGSLAMPPLLLALAVLLWVTGFDLIYASQDYEVDLREGLKSLVVRLGVARSFQVAVGLHVAAFVMLIVFGFAASLGTAYYSSLAIVLAALIYEHLEARRGSVASINRAFFAANAAVGLAFLLGVIFDRL